MRLSAGARFAIGFAVLACGVEWTPSLASQGARPGRPGLIHGQVVDGDSGQPIPEAIVTLIGSVNDPPNARSILAALDSSGLTSKQSEDRASLPDHSVMTDANGRFVFSSVAPGAITLFANASGYLSGQAGQGAPIRPGRSIELADGERRGDVKIRLWKYAAITGMVLDEAGEPAVGARVEALRRIPAAPQGFVYESAGSATADDRGIYRIGSLEPGTYLIAAPHTSTTRPASMLDRFMQTVVNLATGTGSLAGFGDMMSADTPPDPSAVRIGEFLFSTDSIRPPLPANGGRLRVYSTQFHSQTSDLSAASLFRLRSGEERNGVDIHLELITTASISGTVTGPDGPISSVGVRLIPAATSSRPDVAPFAVVNAVTAPDGTFRMLGVPSGQYVASVLIEPPPELPAEFASNPVAQLASSMMGNRNTKLLFGESSLTVGDADVNGLSIVLREGLKVSGRVQFEGSAAKPSTEAIESIQINFESDGDVSGRFEPEAQVDEKGAFDTVLTAGKYTIDVWSVPDGWTVKSITVAGRDVTYGSLELSNADVSGIVIVLTDAAATVSGTIRSTAGVAATASAVLFPADYTAWIESGMDHRRLHQTPASSRGVFTLADVPPADYLLAAVDDVQLETRDPAFFRALAPNATRVTLRARDKRTLDLTLVGISR